MQLPERIERREYKYLTDEKTAAAIRQALIPYCKLDKYAVDQPQQRYTIESLYFDTPALSFFIANQNEQVDRFKLRIRHYPSVENGPLFLEVKRRYNDVILKTRGYVSCTYQEALEERSGIKLLNSLSGANKKAAERFYCLLHSYAARPVMMVRYDREAWVSQIDDYARVTFDRNIRSQIQENLSFEIQPRKWRRMDNPQLQQSPRSMTVVEFKFTSAVPRWMMSIIQNFNLFRLSFSKYGTSILAWHQQPKQLTPCVNSAYRGVAYERALSVHFKLFGANDR